jgi:hypothetical protein
MKILDKSAETVVKELKAKVIALKKKSNYKSQLDKFRPQILLYRKKGATATELQLWLKEKRIAVALSTITRWLKKK